MKGTGTISTGPVWALGCMSGTSMDGVDAAMLRTDGVRLLEFGPHAYRPYTPDERAAISAAQGLWPDDDQLVLERAERAVRTAHADVIAKFRGFDVVGFHGQTLSHDPATGRTHQIGDGETLARKADCMVVWDFRSRDMAAGGQGAPLAPLFHFACAGRAGEADPVAFLNLGGVGNLSYVDPGKVRPGEPDALIAFDTGPGNALIDDLMLRRRGESIDLDGSLAASGTPRQSVIDAVLGKPYFQRPPPKTLDRNDFLDVLAQVAQLTDADAAATLAALTAASVAAAEAFLPQQPRKWLVSGGGCRNAAIMGELGARLGSPVLPVSCIGLDADMLEAQAFAYLAVRTLRGLPLSMPSTTGCRVPTRGGRISAPPEPA